MFFPEDIPGGHSGGVPPLPIPNRAVKPARADGTALTGGRAGRRPFFLFPPRPGVAGERVFPPRGSATQRLAARGENRFQGEE